MFHRPPKTLVALAVLAATAVGCGSTSSRSVTASPTTAAPTTAPTTPTTIVTKPGFSTGPVPAVSGATNLGKEPTIHAATSSAPAGLVGKDLVVGHGTQALPTSTVTVAYVGTIYQTGRVFDASWTDGSGAPVSFPLSGVIAGFKDAIVGMRVGGRREIVIPPAYGYGGSASGSIPANSTLVFVIDLAKVA